MITKSEIRRNYVQIAANNEVRLDVDGKWTFRIHGIATYRDAMITSKYLASAIHYLLGKHGDGGKDDGKVADLRFEIKRMVDDLENGTPITSSEVLATLGSILND